MKKSMKEILQKEPLIVRKEWKLPTYPKLNFSASAKEIMDLVTNRNNSAEVKVEVKAKEMGVNESKEAGLITDTQL